MLFNIFVSLLNYFLQYSLLELFIDTNIPHKKSFGVSSLFYEVVISAQHKQWLKQQFSLKFIVQLITHSVCVCVFY